jgi:hypothetical protein
MHTHTAYLRRLDTGGMRVFASAVDANTHTHAAMSARQCNAENDMASCSGVYYLHPEAAAARELEQTTRHRMWDRRVFKNFPFLPSSEAVENDG